MGGIVSKVSDGLFGKPKTAEAPDYTGAAQATAAGNLEAAKYATVANRANQYNPYGSVTWERGATDYDPWTQRTNFTPQGQQLFDLQNRQDLAYAQTAAKGFDTVKGMFESPNIDTSGMPNYRGIDMSQVSGVRGLSADGLQNMRGLSTEGLQNIRGLTLDGLPNTALAPGQIAQDALLSRINPSLMADDEALRSRLANQGIGLGSAAYNREMGLQGQRATDLRLQAAAQGIGIDQAARQQALGERQALSQFDMGLNAQQFGQRQALSQFDMAQRGQQFGERQAMSGFDMGLNAQQFGQQQGLSNQAAQQRQAMLNEAYTAQSRPLDLINSLRTGSQVQNPQFSSYAQQATTQGADLLGAANSLYGSRLDAANAQNARTDAMIQGLFSAGGSMAGGK